MKAHCWTKDEDKVVSEFAAKNMAAGEAAKKAKKFLPKRSHLAVLLRIYAKRKTMAKVVTPVVGKSFRVEMMKDHIRLYF